MASSGKITVIAASSPATTSTDLGSMSMLLSFLVTLTLIVLLSAAKYLLSPSKLTVIVALPSLTATIVLFTTLATFSSLEVYVRLPASAGIKVAPVECLSRTNKSRTFSSILISVLNLLTVTATVVEFSK